MNRILILCMLLAGLLYRCNPLPEKEREKPETQPSTLNSWTNEDRQFLLSELDRSVNTLLKEVEDLSPDQWDFKENPYRWSIAEIVEHLTVDQELQYRELSQAASFPPLPDYAALTTGLDTFFQAYAKDPHKTQAKWYLQPLGRFQYKRQSVDAFLRANDGIRDFIEATPVNLRNHFTFQDLAGEKSLEEVKPGEVRDLHQLVLTSIAHIDRHIYQIRNVKKDRMYPKNI